MSRGATDGPISAPGGWSLSMFDGTRRPPCNVEPVKARTGYLPVVQQSEVAGNMLEVSLRVRQDGAKQRFVAVRGHVLLEKIRGAPSASIVTVTISHTTPREDGQQAWLVVKRETLHGPADRLDWAALLSKSTERDWVAGDAGEHEWRKTISDWAARKGVEPVTEQWHLPGSLADRLGNLQDQYHNLMLGQPVHFATAGVGLPPTVVDMLGDIVSEHRLPGDTFITGLKRIAQFGGTAVGFTSGNVQMVHACMTSYIRDRVTELLSEKIEMLFTPQPAGTKHPPRTEMAARRAEPRLLPDDPFSNRPTFREGAEEMTQSRPKTSP